jgi:hypothetical protein
MFHDLHAVFGSYPLRLIGGPVIDDKGIDLERFNLFQDGPKGPLGIIRRNKDTDLIQDTPTVIPVSLCAMPASGMWNRLEHISFK